MRQKQCKTCERTLPIDKFKDAKYDCLDGKINYCYECLNIWFAENRFTKEIEGKIKWCRMCKQELPLRRFATLDVWYRYKISTNCTECLREKHKEMEKQYKDRLLYDTPTKVLLLHRNARKRCDISLKDFVDAVGDNTEVCWVCGEKETAKDQYGILKRLCVDHCHTTEKFRGLLCGRCNSGLGMFKDDIDVMASAISYLQQSSVL